MTFESRQTKGLCLLWAFEVINVYFVYLIGSEWKGSSTAVCICKYLRSHCFVLETWVWVCGELTWIISVDVNGKIKVGGFKLSQYKSLLLSSMQVAFQLPRDLSTACWKAIWLLILPQVSILGTPFFQLHLPENSLPISFTSTSVMPKPSSASYMAPEQASLFKKW